MGFFMKNIVDIVKIYLGLSTVSEIDQINILNNLVEISTRNKILPIVYDVINDNFRNIIHPRLGKSLEILNEHEKNNFKSQLNELSRLSMDLNNNKINFVVRKGYSLSRFYKNEFHRAFEDIDILIERNDKNKIIQLLDNNKYKEGSFNRYTMKPTIFDRKDKINYQLLPDHLPHYYKIDNEEYIGSYIVDVAFMLGWFGDKFNINVRDLLKNRIQVGDTYVLNNWDNFVLTALHLFRETFIFSSAKKMPPFFRSFIDVYLAFKQVENPILEFEKCNEALSLCIKRVLELVEQVFETKFTPFNNIYKEEDLLFCVVNGEQNIYVDISLLDRMSFLTIDEYRNKFSNNLIK